jgi:hypothetical protein
MNTLLYVVEIIEDDGGVLHKIMHIGERILYIERILYMKRSGPIHRENPIH